MKLIICYKDGTLTQYKFERLSAAKEEVLKCPESPIASSPLTA